MKKTVRDMDVKGKRVLVRCDFNVPMQEGKITDDTRIVSALPTIRYLTEHGAKVILMSHMGRPKGEPKKEFTLQPVADRLTQLLGKQVVFAASDRVVDENVQQAAAALSLIHISTTAKRDMMHRYNSLYLGKFEEMDIVGYKSQFTQSYRMPDAAAVYPDVKAAWETTRGPGLNPDMTGEGLRVNNFIATYVIGPILVLNPPLAKWFLRKMGMSDPKLAFEEAAMEAYQIRVKEYSDPDTGFYY